MKVSQPQTDGSVDVTCTLTNTGTRDGAQVIQLYVGKTGQSPVERPVKELKNFEKVTLQAGQAQQVTLHLPQDAFTYYSTDRHDFVYDPGTYNIILGFSSRDIRQQASVTMP